MYFKSWKRKLWTSFRKKNEMTELKVGKKEKTGKVETVNNSSISLKQLCYMEKSEPIEEGISNNIKWEDVLEMKSMVATRAQWYKKDPHQYLSSSDF